jgi:hypothetical protein
LYIRYNYCMFADMTSEERQVRKVLIKYRKFSIAEIERDADIPARTIYQWLDGVRSSLSDERIKGLYDVLKKKGYL